MQERFADAQIFEKYSNKRNISPAGLSLQREGVRAGHGDRN